MKKIFNLILLLTLMIVTIGSVIETVEASAGPNNKTVVLDNLYYNNILDDSDLDIGDVLYGSGYSIGGVSDDQVFIRFGRDYNDAIQNASYSLGDIQATTTRFDSLTLLNGIMNLPSNSSETGNATLKIDDDIYSIVLRTEHNDDNLLFSVDTDGDLRIRTLTSNASTAIDFETYLQSNIVDFIYELDTHYHRTYFYDYINSIDIDELPYLYNLTDLYGAGNEPSESEFDAILALAPDYFDTWNYNYYEVDNTIIEVDCQRTATNLITNGDFEINIDNWLFGTGNGVFDLNEINIYSTSSMLLYQSLNIYEDHDYYYSGEHYLNNALNNIRIYNGSTYVTMIGNDIIGSYDISYILNVVSDYTALTFYYSQNSGVDIDVNVDNIMLFDLTEMYGEFNEPSLEEWEVILNANTVDGYTDSFDYDDTCYVTVEQESPIYQYDVNLEGRFGKLKLALTDTIKNQPVTNPHIEIIKYDLNMNYVGDIYEGYITDYNDDNFDGYLEHTFSYTLPEPVTSEEGYIYVAFDTRDNNILASGYLYHEPVAEFYTTNEPYDAIGANSSPYYEEQEYYLFDGNYQNYIFNDSNYLITHFRFDQADFGSTYLNYYSENTDQIVEVETENLFLDFMDNRFGVAFNNTYEGFFYSSSGNYLPPLYNYLQSSVIAHNSYLTNALSEYIANYTNFFYDPLYADNNGVYTYSIDHGIDSYIGETPIYYFDAFNTFGLISHSVKEGGVLRAEIEKPYNYLDSIYDYQYLFDNNTSVYYFEITEEEEQLLYLEVFYGLIPESATVTYHLKALEDYRNGADNDAYDVSISDGYVMREILPFSEKVDNALDMIGLNDVVGKVIFSGMLIVFVTLVGYFTTKNVLAVLFLNFLAVSLLMVLGIIPTWIMLVILVALLVLVFMKRKGE